jgi:hypothetical protein
MDLRFNIFIFANGGGGDWWPIDALCECGEFLASHLCSNFGWAPHDMGVTSTWKHEHYAKHRDEKHPGHSYDLVLCDPEETKARKHAGLEGAYTNHLKIAEAERTKNVVETVKNAEVSS